MKPSVLMKWAFPDLRIPRAAGRIDELAIRDREISIAGWMLCPDTPCSPPSLFINGDLVGKSQLIIRPDVSCVHPWVPHAQLSGFEFAGRIDRAANEATGLELVLFDGDRPVGYLATVPGSTTHREERKIPPIGLMRQIGSPDAQSFESQGRKIFADFAQAIEAHRGLSRTGKMLDWGCGCGRVSSQFQELLPDIEVYGADIAENCIGWCRSQFSPTRFVTSELFPPLPFCGEAFDVVVASSVMTHLKRTVQRTWLDEIKRILVPGGIFLASVLGEYAYRRERSIRGHSLQQRIYRAFNGLTAELVLRTRGISDRTPNSTLAGFIPGGYYMNVFQTEKYTREVWSEHLEVVQYLERGLDNYQDLVVLRKA